jgi:hypothetical protein
MSDAASLTLILSNYLVSSALLLLEVLHHQCTTLRRP